jgi:hypothetical protein
MCLACTRAVNLLGEESLIALDCMATFLGEGKLQYKTCGGVNFFARRRRNMCLACTRAVNLLGEESFIALDCMATFLGEGKLQYKTSAYEWNFVLELGAL